MWTTGEMATQPLVVARLDWTMERCARLMEDAAFHHLPVVGYRGTFLGMLTDRSVHAQIRRDRFDTPVDEVIRPWHSVVRGSDPLPLAFNQLGRSGEDAVMVICLLYTSDAADE